MLGRLVDSSRISYVGILLGFWVVSFLSLGLYVSIAGGDGSWLSNYGSLLSLTLYMLPISLIASVLGVYVFDIMLYRRVTLKVGLVYTVGFLMIYWIEEIKGAYALSGLNDVVVIGVYVLSSAYLFYSVYGSSRLWFDVTWDDSLGDRYTFKGLWRIIYVMIPLYVTLSMVLSLTIVWFGFDVREQYVLPFNIVSFYLGILVVRGYREWSKESSLDSEGDSDMDYGSLSEIESK